MKHFARPCQGYPSVADYVRARLADIPAGGVTVIHLANTGCPAPRRLGQLILRTASRMGIRDRIWTRSLGRGVRVYRKGGWE